MDYEDDILVETEMETEEIVEEEPLMQEEPDVPLKNFPKYSNEKLERVYNKYDFSKSYNPNAQKKDSESFQKFVKENNAENIQEESFSKELESSKSKQNTEKRFNILKICSSVVCVLLLILSMVNLATITDLEKNISTKQTEVSKKEVNIGKLIKDVGKLTDEDALLNDAQNKGMEEITEEIEITLNNKNEIIKYESKTNFFDKICEFISGIFGG